MQADAFLFQELVEPGDVVVVEAPTYDRTLLALRQMGAEVLAIPLEADGIDVAALEEALEGGAHPKLAHVIPNFHNPAGCTLSAEKRERLVALAAEHGFWLFEDDPYRELPFEGETPPTMLSQDTAGRVVHASSFSKTVSPGVRVGYLAGPKEEIGKLAKHANEQYISPNMLAESIVLELCRSGDLDRNIEFVKGALRERRDALVDALREQLPEAEFVLPGGGYFLWLTLADLADSEELRKTAAEEGVGFIAGPDFMLEGGESSLRLSFASVPPQRISEGVSRIARALERPRAATAA
jgi:DNA-binding transcriptional MocR family regulator